MSHIVKKIRDRERVEVVNHRRFFQMIGDYPGNGYSFPSDEKGNPDTTDENYNIWKESYDYCLANPDKFEDCGHQIGRYSYIEPAVGLCSCGRHVTFSGGDEVCECGQWYNGFMQALKDPKYWEDEY